MAARRVAPSSPFKTQQNTSNGSYGTGVKGLAVLKGELGATRRAHLVMLRI